MKFDSTLNIPSLLTAMTLAGTMAAAWTNNNERHARTEGAMSQQTVLIGQQATQISNIEQRLTADRLEFKSDVLRALEDLKRDVRDLKTQGGGKR